MSDDPDIIIHTYPKYARDSFDVYSCDATSQSNINAFFKYFESMFQPKHLTTPRDLKKDLLKETSPNKWLTNVGAVSTVKYRARTRLLHEQSRYHTIDIIENGIFGKMLFLNGEIQIAERYDEVYFDAITKPLRRLSAHRMENIAILGGGSGGTLSRLLRQELKKVYVVDIDTAVIDASRAHLQSINSGAFDAKNVEVIISDANLFLNGIKDSIDAVIYDLTDYQFLITEIDTQIFLDTTFLNIKNSLRSRGVLTLHCCSEFDIKTLKIIKSTLLKHFTNITFRKVFIPSFCENWVFASAEKPS